MPKVKKFGILQKLHSQTTKTHLNSFMWNCREHPSSLEREKTLSLPISLLLPAPNLSTLVVAKDPLHSHDSVALVSHKISQNLSHRISQNSNHNQSQTRRP